MHTSKPNSIVDLPSKTVPSPSVIGLIDTSHPGLLCSSFSVHALSVVSLLHSIFAAREVNKYLIIDQSAYRQ
jgi:hypothetical protein